MHKICLFIVAIVIFGCAAGSGIQQPKKTSGISLGVKYPDINAYIEGKIDYQDMSTEAQKAYFTHQGLIEILRILSASPKITGDQMMDYLELTTVSEIKNNLQHDSGISENERSTLVNKIEREEIKFTGSTSNAISEIRWGTPWIHPPVRNYFSFSDWQPRRDGFGIKVTKSNPQRCFYGIQVISDNYVVLDKGNYKIRFKAYISNEAPIRFNIHSDDVRNFDPIIPYDYKWTITANGNFNEYTFEFQLNRKMGGLLHFKIGELPQNTVLKVINISIEKI